jgi:uncharacterized protein
MRYPYFQIWVFLFYKWRKMEIKFQLQNLLKLQEIDNKLAKLNQKRESYPARIARIQKAYETIDEKQKQVDEQKQKSLKERKKFDTEIEDINAKLSKYNEQLMDVKTNKEYSSMLSEIENLKLKKSELEDNVLEIMEYIDVYNKQLKSVQEEVKRSKAEVDKKVEEIQTKLDNVLKEISKFDEARESLIKEIDTELHTQYEKIFDFRDKMALSRANDSSCEGCHSLIRPHVIDQIREMKEIIYCERCQRILYWESAVLTGAE